MTSAPLCSAQSVAAAEQLAGTAPEAIAWLAIEQPGPYGAKGLTDSHFPPAIGREIATLADRHQVRVQLIRRPGAHADDGHTRERTVLAAHCASGQVVSFRVTHPKTLQTADFAALAAGRPGDFLPTHSATLEQSALLVCTHARRDLCCALLGRKVCASFEATAPNGLAVWETSHLGGHRFAATAVHLPTGWVLGRLPEPRQIAAQVGRQLLHGQLPIEYARGMSMFAPPAQYADIMFRKAHHITDLTPLDIVGDRHQRFAVSHESATALVAVNAVKTDRRLAKSCGDDVAQLTQFTHEWL